MHRFRSFIKADTVKNANIWQEMAIGKGDSTLLLEVTQPMANLLTLLHGDYLRARALDWLMFDGMKMAIIGRQKLCEEVNAALRGELDGGTVKIKPWDSALKNLQQKRRAIGEARSAHGLSGRDPWQETDEVRPADLFSPEAYERNPKLAELRLHGMTIFDYFQKKYEPKIMYVDQRPGEPLKIDLEEMRGILEAKGLEAFRYGNSFDDEGNWIIGYMQNIEKGDNLPPEQKHHYEPNGQYGPDLSLDTHYGDEESSVNGRQTLHLVGGSINKNEQRSANQIKQMQSDFSHIAQQIQKNNPIDDMDPNVVKSIKNMLSINGLLKKSEIGLNDKGAGKGGAREQLFGLPASQHGPAYFTPPEGFDLNMYLHYVKIGLNEPCKPKNITTIGRPEVFGPEWDGNGEEPDGWYRIVGNGEKIQVKFNKKLQDEIFNYMVTEPYETTGQIMTRVRWSQLPSLRGVEGIGRESGKIPLNTLFDDGVKKDPTIAKQFKRVLFSMEGINPKEYIKKEECDKKLIQNIRRPQLDPVLQKLWDAGFRWMPHGGDPVEVANKKPNWEERNYGILKKGERAYKVIHDEDGQFYLMVPKGTGGDKHEPASHDDAGKANLAGGSFTTGGQGGHVKTLPAGPQTYEELLRKLLNGELGEPKKANNEQDLACVQIAVYGGDTPSGRIMGAASVFNLKTNNQNAANINWGEKSDELLSFGVEGLKAVSGSPAFQVGFITDQEFENILKWDVEKQIQAAEEKGWGISALLSKYGIDNDTGDQNDLISMIIDSVKENPIIDLSYLPDEAQKAIGENAFLARIYLIKGYVLKMMSRMANSKDAKNQRGMLGLNPIEDGGGGAGADITNKNQLVNFRGTDDWEAGEDFEKDITPADLRKMHGIPEPIADKKQTKPIATFDNGKVNKLKNPKIVGAKVPVTNPIIDDDDPAISYYSQQQPVAKQQVAKPMQPKPPIAKPLIDDDDPAISYYAS